MPLTSVNSPLVAGSPGSKGGTLRVEILRPLCLAGERQEIGTFHDLPVALARELVAYGKARIAPAPVESPPPPPDVPVQRKRKSTNA